MQHKLLLIAILVGVLNSVVLHSDEPNEDDYYKIREIPIPASAFLEVGGLEFMDDGQLAVSSRRGDIYTIAGATADDPSNAQFTLYAAGLHEVLGLANRDGKLYATQRGEVTRLIDEDKDGRADRFETVADRWGINGDYHEYAFGSRFDKDGFLWVVLCLTGSGAAADNSPFRGWCMRVSEDGDCIATCSGIRSPGGIGMNAKGDMFYTDNQGPWNGTCGLKHLRPGSFQGNPTGNKYYSLTDEIGAKPKDPNSGSRIMTETSNVLELEPTSILFPYTKMGQSASGIACDMSNGKFGPFSEQLFVCDQTQSTVMRVFLEEVNGHYQGACFPFKSGFGSGNVAILISDDGQMFVGGTNRGWGSTGRKPYALERLDWAGKVPFEIHEMRAKPDGFELSFTQPVDKESASQLDSYNLTTYTYIYQASYGSPEVDHTTPTIKSATVADDGKSVRLVVDGLKIGHVHELHAAGIRPEGSGQQLLHSVGYYTLNYVPK
ncbi:MAG: hypothetical protein KDB27_04580 [Planctomycetales bacterium]|nr:hypothetical protein [Planctomycetales bacterium]